MPIDAQQGPMLDFAIVGQPKSGTTALAHFLAQHPQVAFSVPKESAFFATDFHRESDKFHGSQVYFGYRSAADLAKLFEHASPGQLLGEGSTSSLYSSEAAGNLHSHNPGLKCIMLFRDPVEMVQSLHQQYVNETVEHLDDFAEALAAEVDRAAGRRIPDRVRTPSYVQYSKRVRYTEQMVRFEQLFPAEQILVLLADEFRDDNEGQYLKVLRFLGVDDSFRPEFTTVHGSQAPRSQMVNRALNRPGLKRWLQSLLGPRRYTALRDRFARLSLRSKPRASVADELIAELKDRYRPHVIEFGDHIGRDLASQWGYVD